LFAVAVKQKDGMALSDLAARGYSDSSADAVRDLALAANGCKQ
jgi:hypothetical protein